MDYENLPRAFRGRPVPASLLTAMSGSGERAARLRSAAGMPIQTGPGGAHIRSIETRRFAARLVGTTSPYGLVEVIDKSDGTFEDLPGGRTCSECAYELRSIAGLDGKFALRVRPSTVGDYRFTWRRGGPPGCVDVEYNLCINASRSPSGSTVEITIKDSTGTTVATDSGSAADLYCHFLPVGTYTVHIKITCPDGYICESTQTVTLTTTCVTTTIYGPCCHVKVQVCVNACFSGDTTFWPNVGSVVTITNPATGWTDTQTVGTDGCATFAVDQPSTLYNVTTLSGLPRLTVRDDTVFSGCGWPIGGGATLYSVPTGDYLCCVSCSVPVSRSLTCVSKYGTCTLRYVTGLGSKYGPGYYGEITFTEPNCASWKKCSNADGIIAKCTWMTTPTTGVCRASFMLSCGFLNGYGARQWKLDVTRSYVWAWNDPCHTAGPPHFDKVDCSDGKCMPMPENAGTVCYGWVDIGPFVAPPSIGLGAIVRSFASAADSSCYPLSLSFSVGSATVIPVVPNNLAFFPPYDTTFYSCSGTGGHTGVGPCGDLSEFEDTVSVLDLGP